MRVYHIRFTDGTSGYCEGEDAADAVAIAEHLTGKKADIPAEFKYRPLESGAVQTNPYPVYGMIWQFEHPVYGKCPGFCFGGKACLGRGSCPRRIACTE